MSLVISFSSTQFTWVFYLLLISLRLISSTDLFPESGVGFFDSFLYTVSLSSVLVFISSFFLWF